MQLEDQFSDYYFFFLKIITLAAAAAVGITAITRPVGLFLSSGLPALTLPVLAPLTVLSGVVTAEAAVVLVVSGAAVVSAGTVVAVAVVVVAAVVASVVSAGTVVVEVISGTEK